MDVCVSSCFDVGGYFCSGGGTDALCLFGGGDGWDFDTFLGGDFLGSGIGGADEVKADDRAGQAGIGIEAQGTQAVRDRVSVEPEY